jgi:hypothetical protein
MGDPVQLPAHSFVQFRDTMTVYVTPHGRDAVNVLPTLDIHKEAAVGPLDDQGLLGGISLHRRERVPEMIAVPAFELFSSGVHEPGEKGKGKTKAADHFFFLLFPFSFDKPFALTDPPRRFYDGATLSQG